MSRGLFRFLLFCASLLVLTIMGALVLGGNKLQFLFHPERSSQSFVLLGFAHASMAGHTKIFTSEMQSLLEQAEGEVLWSGRVTSVLEGREADNWSVLALSSYPSRSAFIKQYTKDSFTPPFGILLPDQGLSQMLAASPDQDFESQSQVYLLELMDRSPPNAVPDSGVQSVWTASLNPLSETSSPDWQYVRMSGFESRQALGDWLDNIERKTQASLRKRYYRHYVALVVEAFQGQNLQEFNSE